MARIAPNNAKGTRDYLPRDLVRRNRVFALLRETFERYGYEPLETPAIENTSVLEGKYGEEGERLLFRILKRGRDLESAARADRCAPAGLSARPARSRAPSPTKALRYDLTVPLRARHRRPPERPRLPLPPLPDAARLARRPPAARPLPRVLPVRRGLRRQPLDDGGRRDGR